MLAALVVPARLDPMTTPGRHTDRPRWVLALLAAVLAVLVAAFGAAPASAATTPAAQNAVGASTSAGQVAVGASTSAGQVAVGASTSAGQVAVGPSAGVVAGQQLGNDPPQAGIVVATGVAADTAVPIAEGSAAHIFRSDLGHLAQDTLANRAVIQSAADSGVLVRTTPAGVQTFYQLLPDGTQAWARVFRGEITNGGVNVVPRAS